MNPIIRVQNAMIDYYAGDARRINHFLKVHAFARGIVETEGLDEHTQYVLETAALTHDIGVRNSELKYGNSSGEYQQLEGPTEAQKLLQALGVDAADIARVCWLIAHHHTYNIPREPDYQILVEADFLVNICEDGLPRSSVLQIERDIFRTRTGLRFLHHLYLPTTE